MTQLISLFFRKLTGTAKEATGLMNMRNFQMVMESDFMPEEWKWVYDPSTPSNRTVIAAYDPATTTTTVIDFFVISPNLEPVSVKCINLGFANSDHNPVIAEVKLKR